MARVFRLIVFFTLLTGLFGGLVFAQNSSDNSGVYNKTTVTLTGLPNSVLLEKMQKNATAFLSELNAAFAGNREPSVPGSVMNDEGKEILASLWETSPFRSIKTKIIDRIILVRTTRGMKYQLRNIPVYIKDVVSYEKDSESQQAADHSQEISLTFSKTGEIDNISYTLDYTRSDLLKRDTTSLLEFQRRQFVLEFLERLRTAYNRKDTAFLQKVYSDDALIITTKEIRLEKSGDLGIKGQVIVISQKVTKQVYLKSLAEKIFKYNKFINVRFEDIKIVMNLKYPNIYGVNLKQFWNSSNYKDAGYLFLLVDFKNEDAPMIHVRTFQPDSTIKSPGDIIDMGSFNY
ncbi:MAG: nuclear transport factor 2 family protein [Ignavibacteria bacterium]|nr:nuclear transport factor 2 family protein [Ignavibacteria bacterium]